MGSGHSHTHAGHKHGHGSAHRSTSQKRLIIVLVLVAGFMVVEFFGGLLSGSLALLADAGHMLSDAAALGLSLFAIWMARRPPTRHRTYGFYRTEILAALFNGATLIAIAVMIFLEAYERLRSPGEIQGIVMMSIAAAGLLVNLIGLYVLHGGQSESLNMRGAYLHVLSDALGSIGAIIAGAAVWGLGWYWADPVVSAVIAILILVSSWSLVRQSVAVLMEGTPGGIDVDEVSDAILGVPGVSAVHDLHVWSITSGMDSLSVHVVCEEDNPDAARWGDILQTIRTMLRERYHIDHSTIQLEPAGYGGRDGEQPCINCH